MPKRDPIPKKARFEVFKRDKFTCQYCGAKAPDVVLHVDHIHPVAGGGSSDILNLITSCQPCNAGKGSRLLRDTTAIEKQRSQLEELQDRRDQIEMMLEWRKSLESEKREVVDIVAEAVERCSSWGVNEAGRSDIKRWLKRFPLEVVLNAVDEAFETYLRYDGDAVNEASWAKAFNKVPGVASILIQSEEKPYLKDLFYMQGIVRKRLKWKWYDAVPLLEEAVIAGATIKSLMEFSKSIEDVKHFEGTLKTFIAKHAVAA